MADVYEQEVKGTSINEAIQAYEKTYLMQKHFNGLAKKLKSHIRDEFFQDYGGEVGYKNNISIFNFSSQSQQRVSGPEARKMCHELGHDPSNFTKMIHLRSLEPQSADGRVSYVRRQQLSEWIAKNNVEYGENIKKIERLARGIREDYDMESSEGKRAYQDDLLNVMEYAWAMGKHFENQNEIQKQAIKDMVFGNEEIEGYIAEETSLFVGEDPFRLHFDEFVVSSRDYNEFDPSRYLEHLSGILKNPESLEREKVAEYAKRLMVEETMRESYSALLASDCREELLSRPDLMREVGAQESRIDAHEVLIEKGGEVIKNFLEDRMRKAQWASENIDEDEVNNHIVSTFMVKAKDEKLLKPGDVKKINAQWKESSDLALKEICEISENHSNGERIGKILRAVNESAHDDALFFSYFEQIKKNASITTHFEKMAPSTKKENRGKINDLMERAEKDAEEILRSSEGAKMDTCHYLESRLMESDQLNLKFDVGAHIDRRKVPGLDREEPEKGKPSGMGLSF